MDDKFQHHGLKREYIFMGGGDDSLGNIQRKFIKIMLCFIFLISYSKPIAIQAITLSTSAFRPKSSQEVVVGHTKIGSWNNGKFFETITYEKVGYDDVAKTIKYRFRYYITHKGEKGSYIYQKIPIGVFVDNVKKATISEYLNKHISNKTQFCGERIITLKPGVHTVELRDIKSGGITAVNVRQKITVNFPKYTVRFLDYDGALLKTQKVERYGNASAPSVSSKEGKTFKGWDRGFTNIRADTVVTAQYSTNIYQVNFLDWNGAVLKSQKVTHGGSASPPMNPSREGYTFEKWSEAYTNVKRNMNIIACYRVKIFTITFHSNGGSAVPVQTVAYGSIAGRVKDPIKANSKFIGWYDSNGMLYTFSQPVKQHLHLYAYWDGFPSIQADDIYIFENLYTPKQWEKVRMEKVYANDPEEGNITSKVKVIKDTTNLVMQGEYQLTYEVKDKMSNTAEKSINVIVLDQRAEEDRKKKYVRSIAYPYLQTLHENSIWRINERFMRLKNSLQKQKSDILYSWNLSEEDIQKIKMFNKQHGYSVKDNLLFLQEFGHLKNSGNGV